MSHMSGGAPILPEPPEPHVHQWGIGVTIDDQGAWTLGKSIYCKDCKVEGMIVEATPNRGAAT